MSTSATSLRDHRFLVSHMILYGLNLTVWTSLVVVGNVYTKTPDNTQFISQMVDLTESYETAVLYSSVPIVLGGYAYVHNSRKGLLAGGVFSGAGTLSLAGIYAPSYGKMIKDLGKASETMDTVFRGCLVCLVVNAVLLFIFTVTVFRHRARLVVDTDTQGSILRSNRPLFIVSTLLFGALVMRTVCFGYLNYREPATYTEDMLLPVTLALVLALAGSDSGADAHDPALLSFTTIASGVCVLLGIASTSEYDAFAKRMYDKECSAGRDEGKCVALYIIYAGAVLLCLGFVAIAVFASIRFMYVSTVKSGYMQFPTETSEWRNAAAYNDATLVAEGFVPKAQAQTRVRFVKCASCYENLPSTVSFCTACGTKRA
eukprot:GFYU01013717.1.p1 GENE.GFYU01013717.1~~GFYU01013717.1.p1  ORF type:complete len:373 (-),score=47.40 GFYU01013717.1:69-1187(-)